jgi:tRNA threonylcarbamoyladenosine biosynthesis protein TsaE
MEERRTNKFSALICSENEDMTEQAGYDLAQKLEAGMLVALTGDFGAGKTVFTRGIARGLGIIETITSPSFTIIHEYKGEKLRLYHIDLYRIKDGEQAIAYGVEDVINMPDAITVVEWAERIPDLLLEVEVVRVIVRDEGLLKRVIEIDPGRKGITNNKFELKGFVG